MTVVVRAMAALDVPAVLALEQRANPHPWLEAQLTEELVHPGATMLVATRQDAVAAYLSTRLVLDEWHILNVATHPEHRRQGLAATLLRAGARAALDQGARVAHLEVRAHNQGALALYTSLGFARVGVRRGYYAPNAEDAVLMTASVLDVVGA